jgi:NTE family protein/lysophospholipid hydrolase
MERYDGAQDPELAAVITATLALGQTQQRLASEGAPQVTSRAFADETAELEQDLEWLRIEQGDVLCRQGTPSDALYVIMSGRLRAIVTGADGRQIYVGDSAEGETVGEMGVLTGDPRSATVYAARDTDLVKLAKPAFDRLVNQHPGLVLRLTRQIVSHARSRVQAGESVNVWPLHTLALVPAGADSDSSDRLGSLAANLVEELAAYGPTLHLSSQRLETYLGAGAVERLVADPADGRVLGWLNDQEWRYRYVVYEADRTESAWTTRCIRQADRLLLVGNAKASPSLGTVEMELARADRTGPIAPRCELVLLYTDAHPQPRDTRAWLAMRDVVAHHHVRLHQKSDLERLARRVTDRAVGLVLGGGGARGFAHIGVIRALRESGVPIDVVGGTSMGAIIGAQIALGWDAHRMLAVTQRGWTQFKPNADYTVPLVSLLTGRRAVQMLKMLYGDTRIEDLWTTYFCVSSNLTRGDVVVHRDGLIRSAVRASMSIPGLAPPVPKDGDLLVDGGVLNNLPADVMRQYCPRGHGTVIAVDVNPSRGLSSGLDYGESLSAWEIIRAWQNRTVRARSIPSIYDILERMTMLGSIRQSNTLSETSADLYLHPPTDDVRFLDFGAAERVADRGYWYAKPLIQDWLPKSWTGTVDGLSTSAGG